MNRSSIRRALVIALALPAPAAAQTKSTDSIVPRFTLGSTYSMAGWVRVTSAGLGSRMTAAGLPGAASSAATLGIGADVRRGRLLFGAGFQALMGRKDVNAAYQTRTSGSYSLADVGVAALRTRSWSVYPIAGFGITQLTINVKERGDFSFDDALSRPGRELGISGTTALLHTGFLVERRFVRKIVIPSEARDLPFSQFALTIRGGITRSVGNQEWMSDASRLDGGPSAVRSAYVRFGMSRPIGRRRDALLPIAGTVVQAVAQ